MLIIFDLDDTLIDTSGSIIPSKLKYAFEKMVKSGLFLEDREKQLKNLIELNKRSLSAKEALKLFLLSHNKVEKYFDIGMSAIYHEFDHNMKVSPRKDAIKILNMLGAVLEKFADNVATQMIKYIGLAIPFEYKDEYNDQEDVWELFKLLFKKPDLLNIALKKQDWDMQIIKPAKGFNIGIKGYAQYCVMFKVKTKQLERFIMTPSVSGILFDRED